MGRLVQVRLCMGFGGVRVRLGMGFGEVRVLRYQYKALLAAVALYGLLLVQDNLQVAACMLVVADC